MSHGQKPGNPLNKSTPTIECRLGGPCVIVSRESVYGYNDQYAAGIGQCVRCSLVYEPVAWRPRTCGFCALSYGKSLHDPCLGTIPGVTAACCGHGDPSERYGVPEGWKRTD